MANFRKRLVIVISATAFWLLAVVWLSFDSKILHALGQSSAAPVVIASLCAASICACYLAARRMPRYALGLAALAVFFVLLSIYGVTSIVWNIDNAWTDGMFYLIQSLLPIATLIILWQAIKKSKEDKGNMENKRGN